MDYNANIEREFGWDDTIQKDNEFILLPAGDYEFEVEKFERGRYNGGEKMPACNMAKLTIKVFASDGRVASISHSLFLHSRTEWKLSEFFAGIGQKKKDEPLRMNWNLVPGARGRCKVGIKKYNDNEYNEIKKFYPSDPSYNQPAQQSAGQQVDMQLNTPQQPNAQNTQPGNQQFSRPNVGFTSGQW